MTELQDPSTRLVAEYDMERLEFIRAIRHLLTPKTYEVTFEGGPCNGHRTTVTVLPDRYTHPDAAGQYLMVFTNPGHYVWLKEPGAADRG